MKKIAITAIGLLLLAGCSSEGTVSVPAACEGVEVKVNFGILNQDPISNCVEVTESEILASDALAASGIELEGTLTYPDAIVCRVNGLPSATEPIEVEGQEPHLESCADMPPAFAYWALWVVNDSEIGWEYAMEGASTLKLKPGQSIGLAFASGEEAPTPDN